ncbi:MAG: cytochrome c [Planctomycetes bacterium]|nr:cytochrome c [Planctomycetota bacterium]
MSDAHDPHGAHAPEPAEISNPFLWTAGLIVICGFLIWLFFHFLGEGRVAVRGTSRVKIHDTKQVEPDHAALAADRSPEVIEHGQQLYVKNCASCHGMDGNPVPGAGSGGVPPRNFNKDAFKNANGGGPFGIYSVISHGYGTMPAILSVPQDGRYAIAHYIRETWVKTNNAANYIEQDKVPLPKGGGDAEAVKQYPPNEQPAPAALHPLMRVVSNQAQADRQRMSSWLAAAETSSDSDVARDVRAFGRLIERRQHLAGELYGAARGHERDRFIALVTAADSPGTDSSGFALMSHARLAAVFTQVEKAAGADR